MNQEAREDAGLSILIQQTDEKDFVSREAIMDVLGDSWKLSNFKKEMKKLRVKK